MTISKRFLLYFLLFPVFVQTTCFADECYFPFPMAGELQVAYDNFRGIPEGTWNGNTGALVGANFGVSVCEGFGVQAGGSYGVYDWYGRGDVNADSSATAVQQQGFLTGGLFQKGAFCCDFRSGLVVDWMFNKNFGVFALNPSIGQGRLQIGYLLPGCHEVGFWGTLNIGTSHRTVVDTSVAFQAISQANLFWRCFFGNGSETMVWAGVPYRKSLMFSDGRQGQYLLGASFRAPLTSDLRIEGHMVYMGPRGNTASPKFRNYDANITLGLSYAFGMGFDCTQDSRESEPYLPLANNSNFLVDTSLSD